MSEAIAETRQVRIGTAGHVDQVTTALVKALAGIDADTVVEEKKTGTITERCWSVFDCDTFRRAERESFISNMTMDTLSPQSS
jgi:translation initiation factor 2 gamma subunit (eIF-2gamma)